MLTHLDVPGEFNRNSPNINALGAEVTGHQLIELAMRECGLDSLRDVDILDVGCGVRFAQTIINRKLDIGSYTGLEVVESIVNFLQESVEANDNRFRFTHLDVHNAMYNPLGEIFLPTLTRLPIDNDYDLIWLFSVFTHLNAEDAKAMLRLLRAFVKPSGHLFFSAFIDPELDGFEDRDTDTALRTAYFGLDFMTQLIDQAGWKLVKFYKQDYQLPIHERANPVPIVDYFVCSA